MSHHDDTMLDGKLLAAQRELLAIKSQYAAMPATTTIRVPAPAKKVITAPPTLTTLNSNGPHNVDVDVDHPAQKQLEIAEGVMLKLYKKNLALEHQIRQLTAECAQLRTSQSQVDQDEPMSKQPAPAPAPSVTATKPSPPSLAKSTPEDNTQLITTLREELLTQRGSCARFASQNRALRSDFTRLAQQKIQPLQNSTKIGHATQEVLALLASALNRLETERAAETNEYTQRLRQSEEAHIDVLTKNKILEKQFEHFKKKVASSSVQNDKY